MIRIGLFGGAFDPPHIGHLISAEFAIEELHLEKVVFIPSGDHAFKGENVVAAASHRQCMVELAIARNSKFELSTIELQREGRSYTIDTIDALRREHPDWEIYVLIGTDNIPEFHKWHEYERILAETKVAVVIRHSGDDLSKLMYSYSNRLIFLKTPTIDVSSTEIRQRTKEGKDISYLVTLDVEHYIAQNDLYRP